MSWWVRGGNIRFRELEVDDDAFVFECMKDWKADGQGLFSRMRAINLVGARLKWLRHPHVYAPLKRECSHVNCHKPDCCSDWRQLLIVQALEGGEWVDIGATQMRVWKKKVWIDFYKHHNDAKGKGYFTTAWKLYKYMIYEVFEADLDWFEILDNNAVIMNMTSKLSGGKTSHSLRKRGTYKVGDNLKWEFTKADYQANRELINAGIKFEVNNDIF